MQRHISLLGLVLATTLGTLAPALVTEGAGAASTVTQRPATNPSDIDAPDDDRDDNGYAEEANGVSETSVHCFNSSATRPVCLFTIRARY